MTSRIQIRSIIFFYLHQGGYVFGSVCLSVCLSAGLHKTTKLIFMIVGVGHLANFGADLNDRADPQIIFHFH